MTYVLIHYIVPVIHVLACLFLIIVVLLQTGKGADMGAVFGGGSQTLFGSSGAGNFLTRLTTGTAIAFMITSLILTYGASRAPSSGLFEKLPAPATQSETAPGDETAGAAAPGTGVTEPAPPEGAPPPAPPDAPASGGAEPPSPPAAAPPEAK
jgi:preprotein translocase subunit SecG